MCSALSDSGCGAYSGGGWLAFSFASWAQPLRGIDGQPRGESCFVYTKPKHKKYQQLVIRIELPKKLPNLPRNQKEQVSN